MFRLPRSHALSASVVAVATVLLLAPAAAMARDGDDAICTDRPSKAEAACTVPAGRLQLEADLLNGTFQRTHGLTTDTWLIANPTLKYGIGAAADAEIQFTPFQSTRTHLAGGKDATAAGPSDLFLRLKTRVLGAGDDALQAAVIPYVKAPTASHVNGGNGRWEGGAQAPVQLSLGPVWQLTFQPELDLLADAAGGGRHASTTETLSVSRKLDALWTVTADVWGQWSFERKGGTQSSFDLSLARLVGNDLQLDGGVFLGLNRATPGATAYFGVSQRF